MSKTSDDIGSMSGQNQVFSYQFIPSLPIDNKKIVGLVDRVNKLEESTRKTVSVEESQTKIVAAFVSQPVVFAQQDYDIKETTWVNGAEDIYIDALTYYCYSIGPQRRFEIRVLPPAWLFSAAGVLVVPTMFTTPVSVFVADRFYDNRASEIDFNWNFRVDDRAYQYLPNIGGNGVLLPRTVMGYSDRGNILRFQRPLRVRASGSLTFMCKPTLRTRNMPDSFSHNSYGVGNESDRIIINFAGIGYRTGTKLWPRR